MKISDLPHTHRGYDSQQNWGCIIDLFLLLFSTVVPPRPSFKVQHRTYIIYILETSESYLNIFSETLKTLISIKTSRLSFYPARSGVIQDILGYLTCIISYTCPGLAFLLNVSPQRWMIIISPGSSRLGPRGRASFRAAWSTLIGRGMSSLGSHWSRAS